MNSGEVRSRFLKFFEDRGHKVVPSSSLVPENDPSVLFTSAGMQQFKPYYTHPQDAEKDFGSRNVVTIQKCVRTQDIDEVGDKTHDTFFEMLGNFSFGGYWKKEAIQYGYDFITKELGLKIDYISVFEGDAETPADDESREIWKSIDSNLTIKNHNRADNFWGPTGDEGPCGPTTEIYINGVEIWNIVFNEFYKSRDGKFTPLETKGVDTGMGLERLVMALQEKDNIFDTDLFVSIMNYLDQISDSSDIKAKRIIADHIRTATFMIIDGVLPSNTDRGYVLRRLIRRARYYLNSIGAEDKRLGTINNTIPEVYKNTNYLVGQNINKIDLVITDEETHFSATLLFGKKMLEKIIKENGRISGEAMFLLYSSYGYPFELIKEIAKENNIEVDESDFLMRKQQNKELSRSGSEQKFKGGLANHNPETIKLHTAHHLLLSALQSVLGKSVKQKGSNITDERLRIDFLFERKMTDEEKQKVEELVNEYIKKNLNVVKKEMPKSEAESLGAEMEFGAKYGDVVSLYFIEDANGTVVSKEFCGGPHISNTSELGHFKIKKEEAVSAGVRRIKAVLE